MGNNLLTSLAEKTRDISVGEAALYALLGFLVVIVGISFLILMVWLVGRVMSNGNGATVKKVEQNEKKTETKKTSAPIQAVESEVISEETVAVIMAALMAYYEKNGPKCEFTVKRIKRI